jgi:predicted lipoprotein with Yx(FWY)xxD motif
MRTPLATPNSSIARRTVTCVAVIAGLTGALMVSPAGAAKAAAATGTVIEAETSPYGTVLAVGSGRFAGYSVYELTRNKASACTTKLLTVFGQSLSCAGAETDMTAEWPAVTTMGKPVAGKGVHKSMLGTVYRKDIRADQVTYGGELLYLFDIKPNQFTGVNDLETVAPLPPWHGIWYLVSPKKGAPVTGPMTLTTQTQPTGGTVLAETMFQGNGPGPVVVYTYSHDTKNHSNCTGACALVWPPVLTSSTVQGTAGPSSHLIGGIRRADGTRQITYQGHPLYFYDAEVAQLDPKTMQPLNPPTTGSGNGVPGPARHSHFTLVTLSAS